MINNQNKKQPSAKPLAVVKSTAQPAKPLVHLKPSVVTPVAKGSGKEELVVHDGNSKHEHSEKPIVRIKKGLKGDALEQWMMMRDPYSSSLHDPWFVRGAKIPDMDTRESTTRCMIFRRTLTANANGVCGFVLGLGVRRVTSVYETSGSLFPVANTDGSSILSYQIGTVLNEPTASANDLFAAASASAFGGAPVIADAFQTLSPILFNEGRVVSAGARISYVGEFFSMQGKYNLLSVPRNTFRNSIEGSGILALSALQQHPDYVAVAIPKSNDCQTVVHFPIDQVDRNYTNTDLTYTGASIPDTAKGSEIYVIVDGAVENQTFLLEVVINLELLQKNVQLFDAATAPSICDSFAMDHAANSMAKFPNVKAIPAHVAKKLDSMETQDLAKVPVVEQKPMFDQVIEGISKVVDKGLEIGGKLSPIIKTLF